MRVLIACEFSGVVREAFKRHGHDAWSCDLLPTEIPGNHLQEDIFHVLGSSMWGLWDLIIAHPPCTYLCNSGVSWLYKKDKSRNEERWEQMREGAIFFRSLLNSNCERIAIENPIPHKYALEIIGQKYTQVIQPWQFGHGETKATCLWLKGLPPLKPTHTNAPLFGSEAVTGRVPRSHWESPGPERWKNRSRTLAGIAEAMADQWGAAR